ncbi:MAG: GIDE domain-containing protein [Gammaproteobacteria bacterium]|nr:GIDE domain-containing protein [Gammaproteobacteria bacterium]
MGSGLAAQIQVMQTDDYVIACVFAAAACLGGFWWWFRSMKRARLIEDTPTSKCRSAAQGYVELIGMQEMMPGEPIKAPLTGKNATWWAYDIEEKRTTYSKGKRETRWVSIESDTSGEIFLVKDDTGECIIDPDHAEVHESEKDVWYGSSRRPTNTPKTSSMFGGRYRYTERRMRVGDPIYAIGFYETRGRQQDPMHKRNEVAELLGEWKKDQRSLLNKFDTDKDGQIDLQEWESVRAEAERMIEARAREAALAPDINLLLCPPDGRPFILSTVPEKQLTRKFRIRAVFGLVGFLGGGASGTFLLLARNLI